MSDTNTKYLLRLYSEIISEYEKQGEAEEVLGEDCSFGEWLSALLIFISETCKQNREGHPMGRKHGLIQIAAIVIRMIEYFDRKESGDKDAGP